MKVRTKLLLARRLLSLAPISSLRLQAWIVSRAFEPDLKKARESKNPEEASNLEQSRHWELGEYEDQIAAIRSRRLLAKSRALLLHVPDLKWERSNWGHYLLEPASLSRLYYAVRDQQEKRREHRLKLITGLTGVIGGLIGLVAILKK